MAAKPKPPERTRIKVTNAPSYVVELLNDDSITIPIARSWDAIDRVVQEATRNAAKLPQADIAPMLLAIGHLFDHLRMMRDQGRHDIAYIDKLKQQ